MATSSHADNAKPGLHSLFGALANPLKSLRKLLVIARIKQIKNRNFTIIASNCTGTLPYRFLDMPYNTPTINLYFMAPDYIRFVKNLDYYLGLPIKFRAQSRYAKAEATRKQYGMFPVGVLDDIEIHFMHYRSEADAAAKWNRRKQRINRAHMVFAFTDKDLCTPELLQEFDELPFANKFVFTAKRYSNLNSCITIPDFSGESEIGDAYTHYDVLREVNFAKLIGNTSRQDVDSSVGVTPANRISNSIYSPPQHPRENRAL